MNRLLSLVLGLAMVVAPVAQAHAAPPTETAQPAPPPDPGAAERNAELRRAKTVRNVGAISLATGFVLVGVSGITYLMRNSALRRADRQKYYVDEQRLIERARRRHVATFVGLGLGAGLTVIGTGLLIAGATWANRANRRTVFTPTLSPSYAGAAATIRF